MQRSRHTSFTQRISQSSYGLAVVDLEPERVFAEVR